MIGRKVGHYQILAKLGEGGMGEVYRAEDMRLHRNVALKVLAPPLPLQPRSIKRFQNEARSAALLNHPNIVTIYSVEEVDGLHFLTMELVEGKPLSELLPADGLPVSRWLEIALSLCEGLAAAQARGLVHRDLKPDNVMVTPEGRIKILDFGIAKLLDDDETVIEAGPDRREEAPARTQLTEPGRVLGTPRYMSPEQIMGRSVDQRSDLFSLGIILYEMATGSRPFRGESSAERLLATLHEKTRPPSSLRRDLPGTLDRIIGCCLEKEPADRYASASEMLADLQSLRAELDKPSTFRLLSRPTLRADNTRERTRKIRPAVAAAIALIVLIGAALLAWGLGMRTHPAHPALGKRPSVAVLPLASLAGTSDYFVDGMTDALISSLGKVRGIRVISRQSVTRYKGSNKPLPEIAAELGVDMVLEGSILRLGDRVRISAQLVQAAPEEQVWSASYERALRDVLGLQSELSRDIARKVEIELSEQERQSLSRGRPVNPAAFEAYLQGRYLWSRRTFEGYELANQQFEKAARLDPGYAPAYSGMADTYCILGFHYVASDQAFLRAEAAARKALEIDPLLAEAHTSLGGVLLFYRWDWSNAERELQRALELNPSYSTAHLWYWALLAAQGRREESAQRLRLAREIDPVSAVVQNSQGLDLLFRGQPADASQEFDRIIAVDPGFAPAYLNRWLANTSLGREDAALADHVTTLRLMGFGEAADLAERTYRQAGYRKALVASAGKLIEMSRHKYFSPYHIANIFEATGDIGHALEWMETAYAKRAPGMVWAGVSPVHRVLAQEPRYQELLRRMGLPPAAQTGGRQ
jgi:non-specific serine/threonine protein kinase